MLLTIQLNSLGTDMSTTKRNVCTSTIFIHPAPHPASSVYESSLCNLLSQDTGHIILVLEMPNDFVSRLCTMHHNSDVAYRRSSGQFAFQKLEIHLDPSSLLFVVFFIFFFDFLSYEGSCYGVVAF